MTLEQQLSRSAEAWLSEEVLSPRQSATLAALVQHQARARRLRQGVRITALAATVVFAVIFWPVLVSLASDIPVVGPLLLRWAGVDRGAEWAARSGYVVTIGKSASDKGYTFRVDSVLADAARTEVYYVVEGPGLEGAPPPVLDATYDHRTPFGGSGDASSLIDGRLVGTLTLPPLPRSAAQVTVTAYEIAGVQGTWEVSFMASRAELDKLTRSVTVQTESGSDGSVAPAAPPTPGSAGAAEVPGQPATAAAEPSPPAPAGTLDVPGAAAPADVMDESDAPPAGPFTEVSVTADTTWLESQCQFTVTRVLLAPTQTVVEMQGPAVRICDVRAAELLVDGVTVSRTRPSWRLGTYRFVFDRLEGDPAEVNLRLTTVVTWEPGGPVIDLTQTGVRTTYGQGWWFEPQSVRYEEGMTLAVMKMDRAGAAPDTASNFRRWTIVDTEGKRHQVVRSTGSRNDGDPTTWSLEMAVEGEVAVWRLEAGLEAVPVSEPFEMTLPLK